MHLLEAVGGEALEAEYVKQSNDRPAARPSALFLPARLMHQARRR